MRLFVNGYPILSAFERVVSARCVVRIFKLAKLRLQNKRLLEIVSLYVQRAQQRRQLAQLDQRALSDIGLSRADVLNEANKPFWKE
ncbi:hypothetical protein A3762_14870 [Oleiphilus sp. HI0125]|uniref:DUF1127 domain-containing protein n=1 Tax=Oleiphilus sp. HI0125 TaxID=1822266 RepID=UPI0007C2AB65|nr:DUF1127 domain-containing protein [Oleiphilus sp. HI0125]KZZ60954.1 hypothetical protein A3762_14870 [Oleiphilus sp. HI0125]